MPPKGKTPAAALPSEDALLELPEGLEVPEPAFHAVLCHLVSHVFVYDDGNALQDFDPLDSLAGCREEPHGGCLLLQREELEQFAEGGSLASGLRRKAEAEFACARRRKVNRYRQAAIEQVPVAEEADLMVVVSGYPATPEEVEELEALQLFGVADAWVSLHLSGETLVDEPDDLGGLRRVVRTVAAPPSMAHLRHKVLTAEAGSDLAAAVVTELYNCHEWLASPGALRPFRRPLNP